MVAGGEQVLADPTLGALQLAAGGRIVRINGEHAVEGIPRLVKLTEVIITQPEIEVFADLLNIAHVLLGIGRIEPLGVIEALEQLIGATVARAEGDHIVEQGARGIVFTAFSTLLSKFHAGVGKLGDDPLAGVTEQIRIRNKIESGAVVADGGFVVTVGHRLVAHGFFFLGLGDPLLTADHFALRDIDSRTAAPLTGETGSGRRPWGESGEKRSREAVVRE